MQQILMERQMVGNGEGATYRGASIGRDGQQAGTDDQSFRCRGRRHGATRQTQAVEKSGHLSDVIAARAHG